MATPTPRNPKGAGRPKRGEASKRRPLFDRGASNRKARTTKKLGRPSQLDGRLYNLIISMVAAGKKYEEIADTLGIARSSINWWQWSNPNFAHDIHLARAMCDDMVEDALFKSAVGYSHEETKCFLDRNGQIVTANLQKQYPPDVNACKFWLTNRRSKDWSHKEKIGDSGNVTVMLAYPNQRLVGEDDGTRSEETSGETEENGE